MAKNKHTLGKAASGMTGRGSRKVDITERTYAFALRVVRLCQKIRGQDWVARTLSQQLLSSATSVGANVEEAQAGQSRADFSHKLSIALKEARETVHWLRLLLDSEITPTDELTELQAEAKQLAKILGSIVPKTVSRGGE